MVFASYDCYEGFKVKHEVQASCPHMFIFKINYRFLRCLSASTMLSALLL